LFDWQSQRSAPGEGDSDRVKTYCLYILLELIQALWTFQRDRSTGSEEVLVLNGMTLEFFGNEHDARMKISNCPSFESMIDVEPWLS
jgi:hypothetical protein